MRSDPPPLKGATQLRQAGPGPLLHVANSPSDLALVVVVEVIKEVLSCTLQVLQGWGKHAWISARVSPLFFLATIQALWSVVQCLTIFASDSEMTNLHCKISFSI